MMPGLLAAASQFNGPAQVVTVTASVTPFFEDDFSTGDLSKTNAAGFAWSSPTNVTVSTEKPYSGTYSLRFQFNGTPSGYATAEQRFTFGEYKSHVWVEYMIWIPLDHKHRWHNGEMNNKFFALWRDVYSDGSGGTQQFFMEYWPNAQNVDGNDSGDQSGKLRLANKMTDLTPGPQLNSDIPGTSPKPIFMSPDGPLVFGAWNRVRFEVKGSSARTVSDGIVRVWANDTLVRNFTAVPYWNAETTPADVLFRNGYFLGWANSGFLATEVWYVDMPKFYDTDPGWPAS